MSPPAFISYSAALLVLLAVSAWGAHDLPTWLLETLPVMIVLPILWATKRRFVLTPLLYALIFVHACVLMLGAHYTYAQVPLGYWLQEAFALARNPYDGIGHFAQGFVPAIAGRELLLRLTRLERGGWLFVVLVLSCLGVSAVYELLEWGAAVALGQGAEQFLGTQGDIWDTQKDMALAGLGAALALLLLGRAHDRQLARLTRAPA
jgi:putative membrane protein